MSALESLLGRDVLVLTNDGKILKAVLEGFDQACNCILSKTQERVYSTDQPVQVLQHGLFLLRGDNLAVIGEEQEGDTASSTAARPIKPIVH